MYTHKSRCPVSHLFWIPLVLFGTLKKMAPTIRAKKSVTPTWGEKEANRNNEIGIHQFTGCVLSHTHTHSIFSVGQVPTGEKHRTPFCQCDYQNIHLHSFSKGKKILKKSVPDPHEAPYISLSSQEVRD